MFSCTYYTNQMYNIGFQVRKVSREDIIRHGA